MSIQTIIKNTLLIKCKNILSLLLQVLKRQLSFGRSAVFFRYHNEFTHPSFKRFYQKPPVQWANAYSYKLAHWINYPAWINRKPFILEINDHPLSAVSYMNRAIFQPVDLINHIEDAEDVYMHESCKKIVMSDSGMEAIFKRYFGESFNDKISLVKCPGCMPKFTDISQIGKVKNGIACLASDYELKGVDLILKAWGAIQDKQGWSLYLACPNIPLSVQVDIKNDTSIFLVNKAPLTEIEKHYILSNCSITLGPTHIHGGANIVEGMEYGHAIIHFSTHSTGYDEAGKKIIVPYHFYSPEHYGKSWRTISEFKSALNDDKKTGIFDSVITDLVNVISGVMFEPKKLMQMRLRSIELAEGEFSLKARNNALKVIYAEYIKG